MTHDDISDAEIEAVVLFGKPRFGAFDSSGAFVPLDFQGWNLHPLAKDARWVGGDFDKDVARAALLASRAALLAAEPSDAAVEAAAAAMYERERRAALTHSPEGSRKELNGPWSSLGHRTDPWGTVMRFTENARHALRAANLAVLGRTE